MRFALIAMTILLLWAVPAAQGGEEARADGWVAVKSVPAWVLAPPRRDGYLRVVDAGRSNLLRLAYGFIDKVTLRAVRQTIAWRLRPLLGAHADKVAAASTAKPVLVQKAYHVDPPRRGHEKAVGGATTIAWVLWEVPAAPILAAVPEAQRARAATALQRPEPKGCPAWSEVDAEPSWVATPPRRDGYLAVVIPERARRADVAKADAMFFADSQVGSYVMGRLRKLLGPRGSWEVGFAASRWRVARARAIRTTRHESRAWVHWDVPLEPVLAAVPASQRDEARKLLLAPDRER